MIRIMIYSIKAFKTEIPQERQPAVSEVGGKAAGLIQTARAGFPVPEALVLSVSFFEPWLRQIRQLSDWTDMIHKPTKAVCAALKQSALTMKFTPDQKNEFDRQFEVVFGSPPDGQVGSNFFAVRSSSPEEDLKEISFAGMYSTILGVKRAGLEKAIAETFSSMLDYRVVEYKTRNGIQIEGSSICIIVQKQIASRISGIGFSLNPVNNCYDEAVINAGFGLGEAIVSGIVTPDHYVVEKERMEILSLDVHKKDTALYLSEQGGVEQQSPEKPEDQVLDHQQILKLTELIKKVEEHYGFPVDIEWAIENQTLYLLQARPVTTYIPLFEELITKPGEPRELYTDMIGATQGFSEPLSVLGMDLWIDMMNHLGSQGMYPEGEGGILVHINGREFVRVSRLLKTFGKNIGMKLLGTMDYAVKGREKELYRDYCAPKMTPRMKQGKKALMRVSLKAIGPMLKMLLNKNWIEEQVPIIIDSAIKDLRAFKNNGEFDKLVIEAREIYRRTLIPAYGFMVGQMAINRIKRKFKGRGFDAQIAALGMDIQSNPTSTMAQSQFALASHPEFQKTADSAEFIRKIQERSYSTEWMKLYDDYMDAYGDRGFKEIDIATPRTRDRPGNFYQLLTNINTEESRLTVVQKQKREAYAFLKNEADKKGWGGQFVKLAATYDRLFGTREMPKYVVAVYLGVMRSIALEVGEAFVKEGRLTRPEQIFDLHLSDVAAGQKSGDVDLQSLIEKRLQQIKHWPVTMDSRGKILFPLNTGKDGDLAGEPISAGIVTGRARVLSSPYEKRVEPGEILVTHSTEPSWTPVFINAAGVVLEVGGMLQHGAIIAREYGLPCVSGIRSATETIKDGDLLEVDGTNGIVKILKLFNNKNENEKEEPGIEL